MSADHNSIKVAVIAEPSETLSQIQTAFDAQNEFQLVDVLSDVERLVLDLQKIEVEIILIDNQLGGQPTLDIVDDLAMQFPEAAIVSVLPNDDPVVAQRVMLAGARAFLIQPFTQVHLLSTLRRVRDLQIRQRQVAPTIVQVEADRSRPPRTLAVFSPRGGVGCSTVAVNLAIALREATGSRVLLMEGKLFFGHLGVMLNLRPRNNLADLIPHAANIDETLIREIVSEHISGIYALLAPSDMQVAQGIRPQDLFTVLTRLQRFFEYIVIDAGSNLNENTVTLMDTADRILLVTSPDLAALHDVSRFTHLSQSLAYPADKILIILNKAESQGGVRLKDLKSVFQWKIFAQIQDDPVESLRSLNRGVPILLNYPRSPASRSFKSLASLLTNTTKK